MGRISSPPEPEAWSCRRPVLPPLSSPSSSTVPFSWEQQPGIPKPREQDKHVGKASFLPLPPPPAPIGSSFRSTLTSNNASCHAPIASGCRKIKQQQVYRTRLFPVTEIHGHKATAGNGSDNDPFSLALARCAEEARRPNIMPFRLPSPPPRSRRSAPSTSTWGSSKTAKGNRGAARLSSALDLYGSCRSRNAGACRSSVVDSTVTIPRRSSTSDPDPYYGRQNRQYVAYAILYGRHG